MRLVEINNRRATESEVKNLNKLRDFIVKIGENRAFSLSNGIANAYMILQSEFANCNISEATTNSFNFNHLIENCKLECIEEVNVPDYKELKAVSVEMNKENRKNKMLYKFENGVTVNGKYLMNILKAVPNATIKTHSDKDKFKKPILIYNDIATVILLPVYLKEHNNEVGIIKIFE